LFRLGLASIMSLGSSVMQWFVYWICSGSLVLGRIISLFCENFHRPNALIWWCIWWPQAGFNFEYLWIPCHITACTVNQNAYCFSWLSDVPLIG
jgi:hypothetical protein